MTGQRSGDPWGRSAAARRPRARLLRRIWLIARIPLGLLLGAGIFDRVVMPLVVRHGSDTIVPEVTGMVEEDGLRRLRGARLEPGRVLAEPSATVPEGEVVSQEPPAGARVRRGRQVHLRVSEGPPIRGVPDLSGKSIRFARIELAQIGLEPGRIVNLPSDAVPEGRILATRPGPDEPPRRGRPVDLLVSAGPRRSLYVMPDVRGLPVGDAEERLRPAGIRVAVAPPAGIVIEQDPGPGAPVWSGQAVYLQ